MLNLSERIIAVYFVEWDRLSGFTVCAPSFLANKGILQPFSEIIAWSTCLIRDHNDDWVRE